MYKYELYYVDYFFYMYDVFDWKIMYMNCKYVYFFLWFVYYRVCFDNILKFDCIEMVMDIFSGVMNVLVI